MPFRPNTSQLALLSSLEELEVEGGRLATTRGKPTGVTVAFDAGVPQVILHAWAGLDHGALQTAIRSLLRRDLVHKEVGKTWPFAESAARMRTTDERVIHLRWARMTLAQSFEHLERAAEPNAVSALMAAVPSHLRRATKKARTMGFLADAWVGRPKGKALRNPSLIPHWSRTGTGARYSITASGLGCLDACDAWDAIDELVTLSPAAPLTGVKKRTLERYLKKGLLPEPDFRGGGGHAHKWRWSCMRHDLSKIAKRVLPMQFPGSHFV